MRGAAGARLPRAEHRVPGVVRAGARPATHARRTVSPGSGGPVLVVRRRIHHGRALLAGPQHRSRAVAGCHSAGRVLDRGGDQHLGAAPVAGDTRARARGPRGGAELLAAGRVDPVLAGPWRAVGAAATAIAIAAGPAAFALTSTVHPTGFATVALVQPGIENNSRLRDNASQRLSAGLGNRHPGLIVWGESSIAYDLRLDHGLLRRLESLSAADHADILVNQDSLTPKGKSKVAVLISPHGIAATYTKTRLVPFGEYIPFRQQLGWLTRISKAAPANMIPGDGARVMTATLPGGHPLKIGVLICFEAAFPDMSRADTLHGAQVIVYQTSDSTFQQTWALAQHASLGALRAAETGRPAVQAALTGVTAAFDAQGRLLTWLGASQRGVAYVRIGLVPPSHLTLFDRIGDTVPWAAIAICVIAALVALNHTHRPQRLIGIMVDGNRRPVSSVSISEAIDRDRVPGSPAAGERGSDVRAGGSASRIEEK